MYVQLFVHILYLEAFFFLTGYLLEAFSEAYNIEENECW